MDTACGKSSSNNGSIRPTHKSITASSDREAQDFGMERLNDKALRYDHADETLEACHALWNSWDDEAIIIDRKNGLYADPDKVHYVDYIADFIKTRGPLKTPRSPQGAPVIMQAGSSERGRQFAGRWAEIVFTMQHDRSGMQAFYVDIKGRVSNNGRNPDHCLVMPAIDIVVGETESIARERAECVNSLASDELGIAELSNILGVDLSKNAVDQRLADICLMQGSQGMLNLILGASRSNDLTLREIGRAYGRSQLTPQIGGTAMTIADYMQDCLESQCCDGFIVCPSLSPGGYFQFVKAVIPELQRRGIFRTKYKGSTFRENLRDG